MHFDGNQSSGSWEQDCKFPHAIFFCGMAVTLRLFVFLLASMTLAAGQVEPAFTTQPISQTGTPGGNVTFTVAATGT
ncbi:MAG: hypothetical protein NTZ29_16315, partial [Verrucomicrobia bacterium]|nr:hypothetical protein [Verrucomicrobiota bacterium]